MELQPEVELRRYAGILRSWWWLLVVATLFAAGLSWYISRSLPRVYRASTILLINQRQGDQGLDYSSLLLSERLAGTYANLVRQPPVLEATIDRLHLPTDVRHLADRVSARVLPNTQLLEIAVEDENPVLARDIANTIAALFIAARVSDQTGATTVSRAALQQQIQNLESEIRQTSQALDQARKTAGPDSTEASRLQSLLSQQQVTYSQLVQSEVQMGLSEARASSAIKVAVPAELPTEPVRPNVLLNTALAGLIGLVLAVGSVFVLEYLDDTIKGETEVRAATTLPTLATVPRLAGRLARAPWLTSDAVARTPLAEAYRVLRVNLDFAWAGQPGRVILVSSANPGDGKTTTVANLGLALAEGERRVVLVDADLRHPTLHRVFDLPNDRGLTNLIAGAYAMVEDYLLPTGQPNLRLLSSGPLPPNPSELLESRGFIQVLDELRQLADIVVIDTPPLLAVADPVIVSQRADGALIVAEAAGTRRPALVRAAAMLARSPARRLGVVLNKTGGRSSDYPYYYRHHYPANGSLNGAGAQSAGPLRRALGVLAPSRGRGHRVTTGG